METSSRYNCSLCKKAFEQESTCKRHYYYCRSKPSDTKLSRRRACAACVHAKTRCIWKADISLDACARCHKRRVKCEFDTAAGDLGTGRQVSEDSLHGVPVPEGRGVDVLQSSTALIPTNNGPGDHINQTYQYMMGTSEPSSMDNLYINFDEIPGVDLTTEFIRADATHKMTVACPLISSMVVAGGSSPTPTVYQPSLASLFTTRAFVRPDHISLVTLAMRILRSYPSMMLIRGRLPPFINRPSCPWAEGQGHYPQKSLINCAKLVQDFKPRHSSPASKNSMWGQIWHEQERIMAEYTSFDRWELLAALQALLVFCLLRLQDIPAGHSVFDISLLNTVTLVSQALASSVGDCLDCQLPEDPALAWRDWIFLESRRRTVLIFQILGLLVDISTAVSYFSIAGLVLVPLPGSVALWNTRDFERWKTEYKQWHTQHIIYGLSETGTLVRIQKTEAGLRSSVAEWEGWSVEVGEPGMLVMIIGELLAKQ